MDNDIAKIAGLEHCKLLEELSLEKRHAKVYDSVSAQAQIAKLQDTGDMYTRKIELEKRRIEVCTHCPASATMLHCCLTRVPFVR